MLIESLVLISIILILIYKWSSSKYEVLKERNIPHEKPRPFIGNMNPLILFGKRSLCKYLIELNNKFKDKKAYGFCSIRDPLILIKDPELIMKIGIKDFDSFINHGAGFPEDGSVLSRSLILLKDDKWKKMRNTLTWAFTPSKMRLMYELVNECAIEGVKFLETEIKSTEKQELEIEMKEYFTRFTNDVIASAAFGYKINSFKDKENEFYSIGSKFTKFSGLMFFKFMLVCMMPKWTKALGITILDKNKLNYFSRLVLDAIKYREEKQIIRPDMIHLLMKAKKLSEKFKEDDSERAELTDQDIIGQCVLFFVAGFEPISTCLCFTLHELMENPDVQDKLYEEILDMEKQLNGTPLDYDALMKMKYLDMVMMESLRKWPPSFFADRGCSKDYELTDETGELVATIKKGDTLWVPIIAIHRDSKNFDNPNKFDPERFSEENKNKIKSFTYLPFGIGPRSCIGARFATMETKSILYHFMLRFKIYPTNKTAKDPLTSMKGFSMIPRENFWFKVVERQQ